MLWTTYCNVTHICYGETLSYHEKAITASISATFAQITLIRLVGYWAMVFVACGGLVLNCLLLYSLVYMQRHSNLRWKHGPLVMNTTAIDIIGCVSLLVECVLHLGTNFYSLRSKDFTLIELMSFIWVFYVPAVGYAIQGVLQLIAITQPIWYTSHLTNRLCYKIIAVHWLLGIGQEAVLIVLLKVMAGATEWAQIGNIEFIINVLIISDFGLLILTFAISNIGITAKLVGRRQTGGHKRSGGKDMFRRRSKDHRNCVSTRDKGLGAAPNATYGPPMKKGALRFVKQLRLQLLVQFLCASVFLIINIINVARMQDGGMESYGGEQTCEKCVAILAHRRTLINGAVYEWLAYYFWSSRLVVDPSLLIFGHPDCRRQVFRCFRGLGMARGVSSRRYRSTNVTERSRTTTARYSNCPTSSSPMDDTTTSEDFSTRHSSSCPYSPFLTSRKTSHLRFFEGESETFL